VYARIGKYLTSVGFTEQVQHGVYQGQNLTASWCWTVVQAMCLGQEPLGIIPTCLDDLKIFRVSEPVRVGVMDPRAPFGGDAA